MKTNLQYLYESVDTVNNNMCWRWPFRITRGYGRVGVEGHNRLAHKVAYERRFGKVPEGLELDHLCRNTWCWNPNCLEAVTHQINASRGNAGIVLGSWQRAKTHCPQGHPYDEANTYINPRRGQRICRECHNYFRRKGGKS